MTEGNEKSEEWLGRVLRQARALDRASDGELEADELWERSVRRLLMSDAVGDASKREEVYRGLLGAGLVREEGGGLALHEERGRRQTHGAVYTPSEVIDFMVEEALGSLRAVDEARERLRVLDPAVGTGAFLLGVLRAWQSVELPWAKPPRLELWGVDSDPLAVEMARRGLGRAVEGLESVEFELLHADSLGSDVEGELPESFDLVIGNPPYMSARTRSRALSEAAQAAIRRRFGWAVGAWDLYVPFAQLSAERTADEGVWSLIVPNSFWTAEFGRPMREYVAEHALAVSDVSRAEVFEDAAVYPHILLCSGSAADGPIRARQPGEGAVGDWPEIRVSRSELPGALVGRTEATEVETRPLGDVATVRVGIAGFDARAAAECIYERPGGPAGERGRAFVVSGNVDPFEIQRGDLRYQGRTYNDPVCAPGPAISESQWELFGAEKVVLAGMSKRLEAAYDGDGVALGVNTYAVLESEVALEALEALLNAERVSAWYRRRYDSKHLRGGYLGINRGQLESIPVPARLLEDAAAEGRLVEFARRIRVAKDKKQKLQVMLEARRWFDPNAPVAPFDEALEVSLEGGRWRDWALEEVHDIEGLALEPDERGAWVLAADLKLRRDDSPADFLKQGSRICRERRVVAELEPSGEVGRRRLRFYREALRCREAFSEAGRPPGGFTRSVAEKVRGTHVPVFDEGVDVEGLREKRGELERVGSELVGWERNLNDFVEALYEGETPSQREGETPSQREGETPSQREGETPSQRKGGSPSQRDLSDGRGS